MGVGGAFLTLSAFNAFFFNMVNGRGWICVALVVFAGWRPGKALAGALLFAFFDALQLRVQQAGGARLPVPGVPDGAVRAVDPRADRGRAPRDVSAGVDEAVREGGAMNRRTFIGAAAMLVVVPLHRAQGQPAGPRRVGYLGNGSANVGAPQTEAFRRGLRERGWIEGRTLTIEYRWAEGNPERLPALVAELVAGKVDVIVLTGSAAIRAAQGATRTVPVVFLMLADPVTAGFVPSLARPGGNMTGLASQYEELITKQLQLLKEAVPTLSRVALLHRPETPPSVLSAAATAARSLGVAAQPLEVSAVEEFENAFKAARSERAGAMLVMPSPYFDVQRARLIALAAHFRLPAFYEFGNYVQSGGLMSYGPSINEMYGRMASYVDRILRGANPGDLAIERPARFELVINLKTAAALGLAIPSSLLARADEVIQ